MTMIKIQKINNEKITKHGDEIEEVHYRGEKKMIINTSGSFSNLSEIFWEIDELLYGNDEEYGENAEYENENKGILKFPKAELFEIPSQN